MKKITTLLALLLGLQAGYAATGDTTVVTAHQSYVINNYGNYDQWAVFPAPGTTYSKILMKYTFSVPQVGTQWDYTTNVFARVRTGTYDSTLTQYPVFTVNGIELDSIYFNTDPTYIYFYNAVTQQTDSAIASPMSIYQYQDAQNG